MLTTAIDAELCAFMCELLAPHQTEGKIAATVCATFTIRCRTRWASAATVVSIALSNVSVCWRRSAAAAASHRRNDDKHPIIATIIRVSLEQAPAAQVRNRIVVV